MGACRFLHWLPPDDGTGKYSFTKKHWLDLWGNGSGSRNREGKRKGIGKEGEEKDRKERKGKQRGNIRGTGIGKGKEEMRGRRAMGGIKGVKRERIHISKNRRIHVGLQLARIRPKLTPYLADKCENVHLRRVAAIIDAISPTVTMPSRRRAR